MTEDSGRLSCVDGRLHYRSETYGSWTLDVCDLRLVGEFTNQSGPYLDDYFLVFFLRDSDDWFVASFYAEGRDLFMRALSSELHGLRDLGLSGSADFKSRVLWPTSDDDRPLFDFRPMKRGDGFLDRALDRLVPGFVVETVLREEFRTKPAQPGATDNPDDAQRLREDH